MLSALCSTDALELTGRRAQLLQKKKQRLPPASASPRRAACDDSVSHRSALLLSRKHRGSLENLIVIWIDKVAGVPHSPGEGEAGALGQESLPLPRNSVRGL